MALVKDFKHIQTAHCENGVTTGLLKYHGVDFISEPLAFGLGSGIFYIHVPLVTISNGPFISFRSMPGSIFKKTCKALQIGIEKKKFKNEAEAEAFLDNKISQGIPVGCQVGVFHLVYLPKEYRFHFNAHNIIVYGKEGENYLVSDPVMEDVSVLTKDELTKVRFAKGPLAPKGHIYYPTLIPSISEDIIRKGIISGINRNVTMMYKVRSKIIGTRAIKATGKKVKKWKNDLGDKKAALYLGQIVRMQEEIGTGGGGFRFLYAAFLEESAGYFNNHEGLLRSSEDFTKAGDLWRSCAVQMAGIYKGRLTKQENFNDVADLMAEISDLEKEAFKKLGKLKLK